MTSVTTAIPCRTAVFDLLRVHQKAAVTVHGEHGHVRAPELGA